MSTDRPDASAADPTTPTPGPSAPSPDPAASGPADTGSPEAEPTPTAPAEGDGPPGPNPAPTPSPAEAGAGTPDADPNTKPAPADSDETGDGDPEPEPQDPDAPAQPDTEPAAGEAGAAGDGGPEAEPSVSGRGGVGESPAGGETPAVSEAAAELAAQKVERERIARRKAERQAPVEAGGKLSGKAADLLAAVRAVEGGEKPPAVYFDDAPAAPRKAATTTAPPPPRNPEPAAGPTPDAIAAVEAVLARGGAPAALAGAAATALGEDAAERLAEDPWRLLAVAGVRPTQADGFARALLGPDAGPADERRAAALVGWLLEQAALKGHTALEAPTLESALAQYGVPAPAEALEQAIGDGAVLVFSEGEDAEAEEAEESEEAGEDAAPVRVLVGLEGYALAEESLADGLARLANTFDTPADWGDGSELIRAAAGHGLVTHTGGEAARAEPQALAAAARELGLRVCLAAHAPAPGAVTTAGLLAGTEGPGRDADGQFALDLLVVLDAPQLDVETAAALVESVPDGARLVLSGDPAVLGSAGPGRVFADVLAARACPRVVSRVPDPGPIGELVSGIGIGELGQVDAPGKEVVIVPVRDAGEAVHRTVQLVAESVPRAFGIPADSVQVITPGHGGSAGTRALNTALKERLNPGPGRFGGFDPGDRVVHVPSPGRAVPATVVSADARGLHLDGAGARIVVPKERVESQVRHGWAVTAHQAVGARWPAVVVVLPGDAARALSRDWVYTAFGRAERHLSVVHGVDQALAHAVAQVPPKPRTTRLTGLLSALAEAARDKPGE
ncbi:helix-hairpin-helix domain-containing protein [Streptomyces goshikiensis]|uniref:helix-hairpin-helix domain-containing protein n=1 Tax=Streptomyces goshikiensis TaxID=1942 RepID=UPI00365EA1BF